MNAIEREIEEQTRDLSIEEIGEVIYELNKDQYEEKPIDIETFITDSYFLGKLWGDEEGESEFYPFWMDKLKEIHPTPFYSPYNECILHLPIGAGKSLCSLTSICYSIYLLLCLKDPQVFYGIRPAGTQIIFTIFSASKTLAEEDDWGRLSSMIEACGWFVDRGIKPSSKSLKYDPTVILDKDVGITIGTHAAHALGKAVFGGVLDEANFAHAKMEKTKEAYLAVSRRMESRFQQMGGAIPGTLFLTSSPKFSTSFLNDRIEASSKSKKTYVVTNTPIWDIKSHLNLYSGKTFPVFLGDEHHDPEILREEQVVSKDPVNVLDVPIEFKETFEKDLIEAIRDIVGKSISGVQAFFRNKNPITLCATIPHRFTQEVITLKFDDDAEELLKFADVNYFKSPMHPESWRFIHVDLSVSGDRTGVASVYCVPQRVEYLGEDNRIYQRNERFFYMDWCLSVKAPMHEEIPHHKLSNFIVWLKRNDYPIKIVTFDQYQSKTTAQNLRLHGIPTGYLSVDGSRNPYVGLRDAIVSKTILLTRHNLLIEELSELQDDGEKIDHLPHLSKDIADGAAGAFFSCQQSDQVMRIGVVEHTRNTDNGPAIQDILREQRLKSVSEIFLPSFIKRKY